VRSYDHTAKNVGTSENGGSVSSMAEDLGTERVPEANVLKRLTLHGVGLWGFMSLT